MNSSKLMDLVWPSKTNQYVNGHYFKTDHSILSIFIQALHFTSVHLFSTLLGIQIHKNVHLELQHEKLAKPWLLWFSNWMINFPSWTTSTKNSCTQILTKPVDSWNSPYRVDTINTKSKKSQELFLEISSFYTPRYGSGCK